MTDILLRIAITSIDVSVFFPNTCFLENVGDKADKFNGDQQHRKKKKSSVQCIIFLCSSGLEVGLSLSSKLYKDK